MQENSMDEAGTSHTVNIEPQRRNQRKTINQRNQRNKGTHSFHKKPISKPFQRKCDIYVSNKSNFKAQMSKCRELLESEEKGEIFVHCLGNAINRGITLALKLVGESNNRLAYEANTSTIDLIDDLHPLNDEEDFAIQKRKNSCLHIRIYRQSNILNQTTKEK